MNLDSLEIAEIRALSVEELNNLPYGVIEMSTDGIVHRYNKYESDAAGLSSESVIGRNFFKEVALCLNDHMVAERFFGAKVLDTTFEYVFSFRLRPNNVTLRLFKDKSGGMMLLLRHV